MTNLPYKRVLLKLSGEKLAGAEGYGIDFDHAIHIAEAVKALRERGIEVGIVIGGGNIFRGITPEHNAIERSPADHIGLLATIMNGIAIQQALSSIKCSARVMSAIECPKVVDTFNWQNAMDALKAGTVLIFVGGTGNPYFTTDTAAAMRASEIHADILLKATKVDGVFDKDPMKEPNAKKYDSLTYSKVLNDKLAIMDSTAIALCRSNSVPIRVFNMKYLTKNNIVEALEQKDLGTLINGE